MKKKSLSKAIFTALVVVLLLAVHSGVEAVDDNLPPNIGQVTSGECNFTIPIKDNVGVDCSRSTIVIYPNVYTIVPPEPIPLEEAGVCEGCGTPSVACTIALPESGEYTLIINACDTSGNKSGGETPFRVDVGGCEPACASIEPNSVCLVSKTEIVDITIKGINTHFNETTEVVFANPGISMVIATVSENEIKGTLTVAVDALIGSSGVTVKTGDEELSCPEFTVMACVERCVGVGPSSINPGETKTITLTLEGPYDITEFTKDDIAFTCPGITKNSVTPNGTDTLDVNITATESPCSTPGCTGTVLIKVGEALFSSCGTFTVHAQLGCESELVSASLSENSFFTLCSWLLFAHPAKIFIKCNDYCDFTGVTASDITIQEIKVVEVISAAGNEIEAQIVIPPRLSGFKPGEKEVTVNGVGGATLTIN